MRNKPLIGLTGPSSFTNECVKMIENYFKCNFVMIYHNNTEHIDYWLDNCDAVVLAGGADIHPTTYGQNLKNGQGLNKFDLERDIRETRVVDYCIKKKVPLLGICRGHQLIGIYYKLNMLMDIGSSPVMHAPHKSNVVTTKYEPIHYVELTNPNRFKVKEMPERAFLLNIFGRKESKKIWVNSFHHQALLYNEKDDKRDDDLEILGTTPVQFKDPLHIIELMRGKHWISCQWHPEYDWDVNSPSKTILEIFKQMMERDT